MTAADRRLSLVHSDRLADVIPLPQRGEQDSAKPTRRKRTKRTKRPYPTDPGSAA